MNNCLIPQNKTTKCLIASINGVSIVSLLHVGTATNNDISSAWEDKLF